MVSVDARQLAAAGAHGLEVHVSDARVAGGRLVFRRIVHPEHGPGMEVTFRLSSGADIERAQTLMGYAFVRRRVPESDRMASFRVAPGKSDPDIVVASSTDHFQPYRADAESDGLRLGSPMSLMGGPLFMYAFQVGSARQSEPGRFDLDICDATAANALAGLVRCHVYGEPSTEKLASVFKGAGLDGALARATEESETAAMMHTMLRHRAPLASAALPPGASLGVLHAALKRAGVTSREIAQVRAEEVFPGYTAPVSKEQGESYKKLGARYVLTGISRAASVVEILTSGGMHSALEGLLRGREPSGQVCRPDFDHGGAAGVFTRIVTDAARGVKLTAPSFSGRYQLVLHPSLLERLDFYAFDSDMYGRNDDVGLRERKQGRSLIKALAQNKDGGFAFNNEAIFPCGISATALVGVLAQTDEDRQELIALCRSSGITNFRGMVLEDAIQVRSTMIDLDGSVPFAAQLSCARARNPSSSPGGGLAPVRDDLLREGALA